jgi:hypothetical protein
MSFNEFMTLGNNRIRQYDTTRMPRGLYRHVDADYRYGSSLGEVSCPYQPFVYGKQSGNIKDVLSDIKAPYSKIALKYLEKNNEGYDVSSPAEALELAFWWDETLEYDTGFWLQLYEALKGEGEYPEFYIDVIDGPAKGTKKKVKRMDSIIELPYAEPIEGKKNEFMMKKAIYQQVLVAGSVQYKHCPKQESDSMPPDWNEYRDECERNYNAQQRLAGGVHRNHNLASNIY